MPDSKTSLDLQQIHQQVIELAHAAGEVVLPIFENPEVAATKSNSFDVVTEADRTSEALIVQWITEHFPEHHIVGEEGGGYGAPIDEAPYRWYIDPVDGTTNFANRLPAFVISIGLSDAAGNPLVGVIYQPVPQDTYSTYQGGGAWLNDKRIYVSETERLQNAVVGSDFAHDKATNPNNNVREFSRFIRKLRGIRCMGAAALDMCHVAAGRLDGYWQPFLKPWDLMAATLIIMEAGGHVTNYSGETGGHVMLTGQIVTSNNRIHQQMLDVLSEDEY